MFHVKHLFLQNSLKNDILYSKFDATIKKYNWKILRHFYYFAFVNKCVRVKNKNPCFIGHNY